MKKNEFELMFYKNYKNILAMIIIIGAIIYFGENIVQYIKQVLQFLNFNK